MPQIHYNESSKVAIINFRVGVGVDAHKFADSGPCALAGLIWPESNRLEGHSDGDAAVHALCDAVLSAAGMGDVGQVFGIDKPEWQGASGLSMIQHLRKLIEGKSISISNVSIQIVGNNPKISKRRSEAESVLSEALGAPVTIGASTTDTMGFTGRGEGVFVIANALVQLP
ncbi:MAG: 2-C-methyl-D-erythritol 2,4-cyclodiphosphate synthase [Candidatus Nanopelagicaceae bacterium]